MPETTRFAPSPTGGLHLGHAYAALFAARAAAGGRFLVRIEDIDAGRARAGHATAIFDDLAWLGIEWEQPPRRQSEHLAEYAAALDRLRAADLVYPCFCTRRDIAASATAPHGPAQAYPGTCRRLGPAHRAARLDEAHALRLDLALAMARAGPLMWEDRGAGPQRADPRAAGDPVLARKDAGTSYHLAVTLDDAAQGVTLVTRSRDLFEATHIHRLLQALLGLPTPAYHHHAIVTGPGGARLAKRHGAPTLAALRAAGVDGRALGRDLMALEARAGGTICVSDRFPLLMDPRA